METRYTVEADELISIVPFSMLEKDDRIGWNLLNFKWIDNERYSE